MVRMMFTFFATVKNWYFYLFKWGKITTWQEAQAIMLNC